MNCAPSVVSRGRYLTAHFFFFFSLLFFPSQLGMSGVEGTRYYLDTYVYFSAPDLE
jgi:hypothetical protein